MKGLFDGDIRVRITGPDMAATLDALTAAGIPVENCRECSELEAEITVGRKYFSKLERLCQRRGDALKLLSGTGTAWRAATLGRRWVLLVGIALYLFGALYLPSRVLFVRVVGNTSVPARLILEAAAEQGIRFGASRRAVRSEKMKNALLEAVPQLQWAGVNTRGCIAEISVRERSREPEEQDFSGFGHIIAGRDGIITSCDALRGTVLCVPGQGVSAGEILISGYTDCGLTIRAEQAQGEVFALTTREIRVVTPGNCLKISDTGSERKKISLLIGKKRINFWKDSGIWDATCDRMYEEYYITLPGGFQLPIGWSVERFRSRTFSEETVSQETTEPLLRETGEVYLKTQMLSGSIRSADISISEGDGVLALTGQYGCVEMIGFMQRLEIGETNE